MSPLGTSQSRASGYGLAMMARATQSCDVRGLEAVDRPAAAGERVHVPELACEPVKGAVRTGDVTLPAHPLERFVRRDQESEGYTDQNGNPDAVLVGDEQPDRAGDTEYEPSTNDR